MRTFRLAAPIFRERLAPLCPLAGGDGGTRRGSDGRVRWVAPLLGTAGIPHLTPDPLRPQGRRGGYFGHLPGCEICACPSLLAGEGRGGGNRAGARAVGKGTAEDTRSASASRRWCGCQAMTPIGRAECSTAGRKA